MKSTSDLQLSIGYWIVSHKETLRKWWAISLLAWIAFSLIWAMTFGVLFVTNQLKVDKQISQAAARISALQPGTAAQPKDLIISDVTVIARDEKHVDLVTTIKNSNSAWGASAVKLTWSVQGKSLPAQTIFVNPATDRPVVAQNVTIDPAQGPAATITLGDVTWTRSNDAALPAATFRSDKVTVTPTTVNLGGRSVTTVSLGADVTNQSVYNFFRVDLFLLIKAGDRVVAVDHLALERWPTLTKRSISVTWPYAVAGATAGEIIPQVSRFDATNVYR